MKKFLLFVLILLFSLSSCDIKNKEETVTNNGIGKTTVKTALSVEEQKRILTDCLKEKLEKTRALCNEEFIFNHGTPFDLYIKKRYYSFYDVDHDGTLELFLGIKNEDYIKYLEEYFKDDYLEYIKEGKLGNIYPAELYRISDGKSAELIKQFYTPDSESAGVPIVYGNGVIRDGGRNGEEDIEVYEYSNGKAEVLAFLSYRFHSTPTEADDEYEISYFENGVNPTKVALTKEEYYLRKAEMEVEPVNADLEWREVIELLVEQQGE